MARNVRMARNISQLTQLGLVRELNPSEGVNGAKLHKRIIQELERRLNPSEGVNGAKRQQKVVAVSGDGS